MNIYAFADEASDLLSGQIAAMKRNHLQGLEIRSVDGENISDISLDKAREIRKELDANGLVTWSIGSPIGKIKYYEVGRDGYLKDLDKCKHTLEVADILGAKNIRMFSIRFAKDADFDTCKDESIEMVGGYLDLARGTGISLCHENEKGVYGDIARRELELLKALPELKAVFDPANFVQCGQDTLEAWDMLKDYVHYMHIKDALENGVVVPAGMGKGNVKAIVSAYRKRGGENFTIEPHLHDFGTYKNLETNEERIELGTAIHFANNDESFDYAVKAFRELAE